MVTIDFDAKEDLCSRRSPGARYSKPAGPTSLRSIRWPLRTPFSLSAATAEDSSPSAKNLFAVRRGVLKFRGFKPKKIPIATAKLTDDNFVPDFEQKGVDMRIGLDMANLQQL
jgi:hypothetical protein